MIRAVEGGEVVLMVVMRRRKEGVVQATRESVAMLVGLESEK